MICNWTEIASIPERGCVRSTSRSNAKTRWAVERTSTPLYPVFGDRARPGRMFPRPRGNTYGEASVCRQSSASRIGPHFSLLALQPSRIYLPEGARSRPDPVRNSECRVRISMVRQCPPVPARSGLPGPATGRRYTFRTLDSFPVCPGFPRGRGKRRPWRARSPVLNRVK